MTSFQFKKSLNLDLKKKKKKTIFLPQGKFLSDCIQVLVSAPCHNNILINEAMVVVDIFFFFLGEFQPMVFTLDDSYLSSNQDTNQFLV